MVNSFAEESVSPLEQQLIELGRRIARERQTRGMAVEDVARLSKVSVPTIARIELGNGGVGWRNLVAVMNALGLSPISEDSLAMRQEELPVHALHLNSDAVQEAVEEAARAACTELDALFPDSRPEVDGLNSNFQGLLVEHLKAMLCGEMAYRSSHHIALNRLVYSDGQLGREYHLKEGADGFLVRLVDTEQVLDDGRFRPAHRVNDLYTSWEYAAEAVHNFVSKGEHLPGPVRIVSGWFSGKGVRFTAPARVE